MRLYYLDELRLQFAEDTHVCPRAGITQHGVYDSLQEDRSGVLKVGAVGTGSTLDALDEWMDRCREGIAAPTTEQPRMSPRFPGFSESTGFRTGLVYDESGPPPVRWTFPHFRTNRAEICPELVHRIQKNLEIESSN
jgi:hypothetical protein